MDVGVGVGVDVDAHVHVHAHEHVHVFMHQLVNLAANNAVNKAQIAAHGGIEHIIAAMAAHSASPGENQ